MNLPASIPCQYHNATPNRRELTYATLDCACCTAVFLFAGNVLAQVNPAVVGGMKWRQIGPFRGGRVLAVAGVPGDPNTYYFGAVAGGIFKSTNGGLTWTPTFDHESISSIGAIAVADSDPNILYAGSGEACLRGNISYGDGVYKSTDAGRTWKNVGLKDSRHIGAVIIDPRNPDIVLVAALGHAWGPNTERGVFRTADGGKTWQKVLYHDENTGAIDVVFDPRNSSVVYASLWQVRRQPWYFNSGGPGSGLYKSVDGGLTWKQLQGNGLPEGNLGRIGISVSGADSNRVYALIEAEEGGLYRSNDAGNSWTRVNEDRTLPPARLVFQSRFRRSQTGGHGLRAEHRRIPLQRWRQDFRACCRRRTATITVCGSIPPTRSACSTATMAESRFQWTAARPGRRRTTSPRRSSTTSPSTTTGPIASMARSRTTPPWPSPARVTTESSRARIGTKSAAAKAAISRPIRAIRKLSMPDPTPPSSLATITAPTRLRMRLPTRSTPRVTAPNALKYRFQWTEPVFVSAYDSNVIYTAAQNVFKSTDQGHSWTPISPDLTRNDKEKQKPSGGDITLDITSVEYYDTVFALAESPLQKGMLWAGTDDGLIHLTRDDGKTWENVTPKGMPEWSMVSIIEASPHDAGTAYAAIDRHKLDDFNPFIYKTHDYRQDVDAD